MPIDFSPPSGSLQGYQITSPQSTDPLQTLAQMGQLRTQNLQQQQASMQLEQERQSLDSAKALMQIMTETKPGETFQQTYQRAAATGKILPAHLKQIADAGMEYQKGLDVLDDNKRKRMAAGISTIRPLYEGVTDQTSLDAANQSAVDRGVPQELLFKQPYTDKAHLTAHVGSLIPVEQAIKETQEKAATEASQAATAASTATTKKTGLETDALTQEQARKAFQSEEFDPKTGTPTPAAKARVQTQYPTAKLPQGNAPKADWDRFLTGDMNLGLPKDETALAVIANDPNRPQVERDRATNALKTLKAQKEVANTETELARVATDPNSTPEQRAAAGAALNRLDQSRQASRPIVQNVIPGVATAPLTGDAAQVHGEEFLKTLPPAFAARIKAIATGNGDAPTGRAATQGAGLQMMNALYQYDPEYSPLLAQQRKETLKEFTNTGNTHAGGQLIALNTVIHHADLYLDAVAALKNGTFKPGNAIYNKVATMFGAAPPTTAALLSRFFASETGKVATGGVPAEGEINGILQSMSTDGSPEAMERAGKTLIQIAAGRMTPLKERRDKAHLEKFVDILGPDAQSVLVKRGFDPETMKPVQAAGSPVFIKIGGKRYQYKGSGAKSDLNNYTEVPTK